MLVPRVVLFQVRHNLFHDYIRMYGTNVLFLLIEKPAAATGQQPHKWGRAYWQPRQQPHPRPTSEESARCPAHHYLRWPHHDLRLPGSCQF